MNKEKSKLIAFSFAFYNKGEAREAMLSKTAGLEESHQKIIGKETYNTLLMFVDASLEKQRELLAADAHKIIECFISAIFNLESEMKVLENLLPYLDAILFGKLTRRQQLLQHRTWYQQVKP